MGRAIGSFLRASRGKATCATGGAGASATAAVQVTLASMPTVSVLRATTGNVYGARSLVRSPRATRAFGPVTCPAVKSPRG
jgi:hypothetical protein